MRILFVGNQFLGSNATSLAQGFSNLGNEVKIIDPNNFLPFENRLNNRIAYKFDLNRVYSHVCERMERHLFNILARERFDIMFVFKGLGISENVLKSFPGVTIHYHPDDSSNGDNTSLIFNLAEKYYDFHFTSKRHNIEEIQKRTGNHQVHFIWYAYDDKLHRLENSYYSNHNFGFIGTRRPDRVKLINSLSKKYRKRFYLAGHAWSRDVKLRARCHVMNEVYGGDYLNLIRQAPIQLGLLNSENRDTHTARSFELPASGALLLAQRTYEHQSLLEDNEEAVFFSDEDELISKLDWLLNSPQEVERIRINGYNKMLNSSNTWTDRAGEILKVIAS